MSFLPKPQPDPDLTAIAPVGSFFTDEHRFVRILEVDRSGALGEDELAHDLVELSPEDLTGRTWRKVTPLTNEEMNH